MNKQKRPNAILIQCNQASPFVLSMRVDKRPAGTLCTTTELVPGFIDEVINEFSDKNYIRAGMVYFLSFPACCHLYQLAIEYCNKKGVVLDAWSINPKTGDQERHIMMVEKYDPTADASYDPFEKPRVFA